MRQAVKTLHITEKTFVRLWDLFRIKCTNDEAVASMLWFISMELNYDENDFAQLMIEYRKATMIVEQETFG